MSDYSNGEEDYDRLEPKPSASGTDASSEQRQDLSRQCWDSVRDLERHGTIARQTTGAPETYRLENGRLVPTSRQDAQPGQPLFEITRNEDNSIGVSIFADRDATTPVLREQYTAEERSVFHGDDADSSSPAFDSHITRRQIADNQFGMEVCGTEGDSQQRVTFDSQGNPCSFTAQVVDGGIQRALTCSFDPDGSIHDIRVTESPLAVSTDTPEGTEIAEPINAAQITEASLTAQQVMAYAQAIYDSIRDICNHNDIPLPQFLSAILNAETASGTSGSTTATTTATTVDSVATPGLSSTTTPTLPVPSTVAGGDSSTGAPSTNIADFLTRFATTAGSANAPQPTTNPEVPPSVIDARVPDPEDDMSSLIDASIPVLHDFGVPPSSETTTVERRAVETPDVEQQTVETPVSATTATDTPVGSEVVTPQTEAPAPENTEVGLFFGPFLPPVPTTTAPGERLFGSSTTSQAREMTTGSGPGSTLTLTIRGPLAPSGFPPGVQLQQIRNANGDVITTVTPSNEASRLMQERFGAVFRTVTFSNGRYIFRDDSGREITVPNPPTVMGSVTDQQNNQRTYNLDGSLATTFTNDSQGRTRLTEYPPGHPQGLLTRTDFNPAQHGGVSSETVARDAGPPPRFSVTSTLAQPEADGTTAR